MEYSWDIVKYWRNMNLDGGSNHLEKYEFVNGKDDIPFMKWEKNMFQTTHQKCIAYEMQ